MAVELWSVSAGCRRLRAACRFPRGRVPTWHPTEYGVPLGLKPSPALASLVAAPRPVTHPGPCPEAAPRRRPSFSLNVGHRRSSRLVAFTGEPAPAPQPHEGPGGGAGAADGLGQGRPGPFVRRRTPTTTPRQRSFSAAVRLRARFLNRDGTPLPCQERTDSGRRPGQGGNAKAPALPRRCRSRRAHRQEALARRPRQARAARQPRPAPHSTSVEGSGAPCGPPPPWTGPGSGVGVGVGVGVGGSWPGTVPKVAAFTDEAPWAEKIAASGAVLLVNPNRALVPPFSTPPVGDHTARKESYPGPAPSGFNSAWLTADPGVGGATRETPEPLPGRSVLSKAPPLVPRGLEAETAPWPSASPNEANEPHEVASLTVRPMLPTVCLAPPSLTSW